MSATHIGMASGAVMPENRAMPSHFDACVPRRSITRSKSNMSWQVLESSSRKPLVKREPTHSVKSGQRVFSPAPHKWPLPLWMDHHVAAGRSLDSGTDVEQRGTFPQRRTGDQAAMDLGGAVENAVN